LEILQRPCSVLLGLTYALNLDYHLCTPLRYSKNFSWNWINKVQSRKSKLQAWNETWVLRNESYLLENCTFESAMFVSWHWFVPQMSWHFNCCKFKVQMYFTLYKLYFQDLCFAIMEYFSLRSLLTQFSG